jgi:hypothetical protein
MLRMLRITLASVAAIAALLAAGTCIDSGFDWEQAIGLCNVPVRSTTSDPNGKLSAVVFEVYCGPMPPDNTHVSLVPKDKVFSRKRNPDFLVLAGSHDLAVQWTGELALEVSIPATARVFKNETSVGPVTVIYRPAL